MSRTLTMYPGYKYGLLGLVLASCLQTFSPLVAAAVTSVAWLLMGGHYTLYLMYHTLPRDLM